jgi:hypothetical protein
VGSSSTGGSLESCKRFKELQQNLIEDILSLEESRSKLRFSEYGTNRWAWDCYPGFDMLLFGFDSLSINAVIEYVAYLR